jgi:hypothetical protein
MSVCSFRSPIAAITLAVLLAIAVFAVPTVVADGVGDADDPDPGWQGIWSTSDQPPRVSYVPQLIWLDHTALLVVV